IWKPRSLNLKPTEAAKAAQVPSARGIYQRADAMRMKPKVEPEEPEERTVPDQEAHTEQPSEETSGHANGVQEEQTWDEGAWHTNGAQPEQTWEEGTWHANGDPSDEPAVQAEQTWQEGTWSENKAQPEQTWDDGSWSNKAQQEQTWEESRWPEKRESQHWHGWQPSSQPSQPF
ncbi:unnamed protein product, partial [Symbiodinium necroappetens]